MKRIEKAIEALNSGFTSKAGQKRAFQLVSADYEDIERAIMSDLNARRFRDEITPEYHNALYWGRPDLHNWKEKHAAMYRDDYPDHVADVTTLKELRDAIKNAVIVPPEPKRDEKIERIEKSIHDLLELRRGQFERGLKVAELFNGLPVSVRPHWVTNQHGTTFIRCFYYLAGELTPLNMIIAIAEAHADGQEAGA